MKKAFFFLLVLLLFTLVTACSGEADDTTSKAKEDMSSSNTDEEKDKEQAGEKQETKIIATTVAATEIFDALELDLIGIPTSYKELPKRYDGVTEIGNPMNPDMELIKSLDPTVVYSVTTLQSDLESVFNNINLPAKFVNLQSIESMLEEITNIGADYNREEEASIIVTNIEEKLEEIETEAEGKESPTVLILMGVPGSYLVATEHSYIGDLVRRAGGINIVQGENVEYLASNTEYLQQANPDIILRAAHGMPEEVVKMFDEEFKTNDIWKHFNAVQNNHVYDLEELLFGTTGNLAVIEAMDELMRMLYPEN